MEAASWFGVPFRVPAQLGDFRNSQKYWEILGNHLCNSARRLSIGRRWVFQPDNDPIHTSGQTFEWLNRHSVTVPKRPSQTPNLNSIEVGVRQSSNLGDLERICVSKNKMWILNNFRNNLVSSYKSLLDTICKLYLLNVLMHSDIPICNEFLKKINLFLEHYEYLFDPLYIFICIYIINIWHADIL